MKIISLRTAMALSVTLPTAYNIGWIYHSDAVSPEWWEVYLWTRSN